MEKAVFEKAFIEKLNKNYPDLGKYFEFELKVFCEFNTLIFEINKCLILELNRASITLTNHLLERLLKLALINHEAGIEPIPIEQWNDTYKRPNEKYGGMNLGQTIGVCKKLGLIMDEEKKLLDKTVRNLLRNGFSHADSSEILKDIPDNTKMYMGSFTNPKEGLEEVSVDQKIIPTFQALQMEEFAKAYAKPYFDFVFKLIFKIEERLIEKLK
ncbi:hypothetical protein [Marinifilum sp. D737]|uniref:hypothetical protein n=1 Tax=Marinifilum sp. D737 TaxID=2969628 RepID=UPI00227611EA|nr:hypothetical protein [Marinifilum sp. D737]MCY1635061.1 hypothetical protein [Marinifilum sp. D737]